MVLIRAFQERRVKKRSDENELNRQWYKQVEMVNIQHLPHTHQEVRHSGGEIHP